MDVHPSCSSEKVLVVTHIQASKQDIDDEYIATLTPESHQGRNGYIRVPSGALHVVL